QKARHVFLQICPALPRTHSRWPRPWRTYVKVSAGVGKRSRIPAQTVSVRSVVCLPFSDMLDTRSPRILPTQPSRRTSQCDFPPERTFANRSSVRFSVLEWAPQSAVAHGEQPSLSLQSRMQPQGSLNQLTKCWLIRTSTYCSPRHG